MATRVKEKAAARKANADKRPHATVKYVRVAPRKMKIVVDLIRGKQVDQALAILQFTPKAGAPVVEKLLNSAIANAENNLEMDRSTPVCRGSLRQSGPDPQALLGAFPRSCRHDQKAHQPRYRSCSTRSEGGLKMGQKVNPHGARVGVIIDWSTKWYAGKKDFSNNLIEDYNLRKMLKEKLNQAGISHIDLQRAARKAACDRLHREAGHRDRQGRRRRGSAQEGN